MAVVAEGLEPEAAATEDAARDAVDAVDAAPRPPPLLTGSRLNLDLYPGGCHRLLHLCARPSAQLLEVQFLRLSGHEDPRLLETTLAQVVCSLRHLRSLVLRGEPSCSRALSQPRPPQGRLAEPGSWTPAAPSRPQRGCPSPGRSWVMAISRDEPAVSVCRRLGLSWWGWGWGKSVPLS